MQSRFLTLLTPLLTAVSALWASPAHAITFGGAPVATVSADRFAGDLVSGTAELDRLRIHHCSGGFTDYIVNATIDPVAGYDVAIDPGDHCKATWFFDTDLEFDGDGSLGLFTVESTQRVVSVDLELTTVWESLSPWSITSGSATGPGPEIGTLVQ